MKKILLRHFPYVLLVILLSFIVSTLIPKYEEQQFSYLASSFLKGRLDISSYPIAWNDASIFNGKYFWPLGPFPSVILIPFVYVFSLFNLFFYQKFLQVPLVLAIFFLCYKLARRLKYNQSDSIYLAIAFNFASVFVAIIQNSWSWQFAMVVSVFLIFLGIIEYFGKKRYLIIGLIYGCLFLTRATASLGIAFFFLEILLGKSNIRIKLKNLLKLLTPYFISVVILGIYNLARFGSFFEQGYSYQLSEGGALIARGYGLFNLIHLPGNLYYFLLATPTPILKDGVSRVLSFPYLKFDPWGMGIFYTSPYFLYLFFLKYKDRISKMLLFTVLVVALPIFLYYGIGVFQFGYRYSLDFLPYLFLILIKNYREQKGNLSFGFKAVIITSSLFNLYLLATYGF
jgi:hypothetical protein